MRRAELDGHVLRCYVGQRLVSSMGYLGHGAGEGLAEVYETYGLRTASRVHSALMDSVDWRAFTPQLEVAPAREHLTQAMRRASSPETRAAIAMVASRLTSPP